MQSYPISAAPWEMQYVYLGSEKDLKTGNDAVAAPPLVDADILAIVRHLLRVRLVGTARDAAMIVHVRMKPTLVIVLTLVYISEGKFWVRIFLWSQLLYSLFLQSVFMGFLATLR